MKLCKGISSCYCAADFMVHSTLFDGDERNQAADLLNAIQALSQTYRSHTPHECHEGIFARGNEKGKNLREDNQWMFCRRMGNLDRIIEHPN